MGIKNTNLVVVTGFVRDLPVPVKEGSEYYRTRIGVLDEEYGRDVVIEFGCKRGEWMDNAHTGDLIAVSGSLGGRFSAQGYYNLSFYARSVEVVGGLVTAAAAAEPAPEDGDIAF